MHSRCAVAFKQNFQRQAWLMRPTFCNVVFASSSLVAYNNYHPGLSLRLFGVVQRNVHLTECTLGRLIKMQLIVMPRLHEITSTIIFAIELHIPQHFFVIRIVYIWWLGNPANGFSHLSLRAQGQEKPPTKLRFPFVYSSRISLLSKLSAYRRIDISRFIGSTEHTRASCR